MSGCIIYKWSTLDMGLLRNKLYCLLKMMLNNLLSILQILSWKFILRQFFGFWLIMVCLRNLNNCKKSYDRFGEYCRTQHILITWLIVFAKQMVQDLFINTSLISWSHLFIKGSNKWWDFCMKVWGFITCIFDTKEKIGL